MIEKRNTLDHRDTVPDARSNLTIPDLLRMVWNKKLFFLITFMIGFCATLFVISRIDIQYTAQSIIVIKNEGNQGQIEEFSLLADSSHIGMTSLRTELDVLKSRTLVSRLAKRLALMNDPEFNMKAQNTGKTVNLEISGKQQSTFKNLSVNGVEVGMLNAEIVDDDVAATVTNILKKLEASFVPESLAVTISFTSQNPQKAALIVNTLINEYEAQRMESRHSGQKRVTEWMSKRVAKLRKQVFAAEKKVEKFSIANDLVSGDETIISQERLTALKTKLSDAKANYHDAKIKLQQSRRSDGKLNSLTAANNLNAEVIKDLELQKTRLASDISELANRYGPKHPIMIGKKSELSVLERKINEEHSKINKALQNEVNMAKAQVDDIQKEINAAGNENTYNGGAQIRLRELEREAEASRIVLQTFLETYKKALNQNGLQESGVHILSYANTPDEPSSPNKKTVLNLGILMSLVFGVLVALLMARLDTRIKTIQDAIKATGLSCKAVIPNMRGLGSTSLTKYIHTNPSSRLTEAIRSLCIGLGGVENASQVISFLSSGKNEGKTTLAALSATVLAKAGHKVIIVDANLRSPGIGEAIKKSAGTTLVEYLTGHKDLEDVISKDPETGLDIIFGQAIPNTAFDVLNSRKTAAMITSLRSQYDYIIIDTPPCGVVSDAKILARLADQNVFILSWNKTTSIAADKAMKHLDDIPSSSLVMVLNNVKSNL